MDTLARAEDYETFYAQTYYRTRWTALQIQKDPWTMSLHNHYMYAISIAMVSVASTPPTAMSNRDAVSATLSDAQDTGTSTKRTPSDAASVSASSMSKPTTSLPTQRRIANGA